MSLELCTLLRIPAEVDNWGGFYHFGSETAEGGMHPESALENYTQVRRKMAALFRYDGELYDLIYVVEPIHLKVVNVVKPEGRENVGFAASV